MYLSKINYKVLSKEEIEKFREIDRSEIMEYDYHYINDKLESIYDKEIERIKERGP
jgi:hypothetical protein